MSLNIYADYVGQAWCKIHEDKDYDSAIELATKAIEMYPNELRAYELRALAYLNVHIGEPEDIRREYREKAEADLIKSIGYKNSLASDLWGI